MPAPKGHKFSIGNQGGRPPHFKSIDSLEKLISSYFKEIIENEPATITGLALYLGFESRQSFYDYEKDEKFSYIIKKARLRIEYEYEKKLTGQNVAGPVFALKNMGWKDRSETEIIGTMAINWHEEKTYEAK